MEMRKHIDKYLNYWLIGFVSLLVLFFFPFVGSEAGLQLALPNTVAGWIVFVITKITVAILNMVILFLFFEQSKVNVRDDPRYIEAITILNKFKIKEIKYISPEDFTKGVYGKKGAMTFITSILGAFSLTQAILTFDLAIFLSYLITLSLGVVSGIYQMKVSENYWTNQQWYYAKHIEQEQLAAEAKKTAETEDKQCL